MNNKVLSIILFSWSLLAISQENKTLIPFKKSNLWGFSDVEGNLIIPADYDTVYFFGKEMARVVKNGFPGYIKTNGSELIPCDYVECDPLILSHFVIQKDGKYGIIDTLGEMQLPFEYDSLSRINDDAIRFTLNNRVGALIWEDGMYKPIIEPLYKWISWDKTHYVCTNIDGSTINLTLSKGNVEEWIAPATSFDNGNPFRTFDQPKNNVPKESEIYSKEGKQGLINPRPAYILVGDHDTLPANYDTIIKLKSSNLYLVAINEKWGLLGMRGEDLLSPLFDKIDTNNIVQYGSMPIMARFYVKKNGKWGLVCQIFDKASPNFRRCVEVIPFEYKEAKGHLANPNFGIVRKRKYYGLFSLTDGSEITKLIYRDVLDECYRINGSLELFRVETKKGDFVFVGTNGFQYYSN